jgi:hypothetical protein
MGLLLPKNEKVKFRYQNNRVFAAGHQNPTFGQKSFNR